MAEGVSPPSGVVTFLFTDVEGSTRLWEEHPAEMQEALQLHDQILRTQIATHQGYVFSTAGDSFAAAFEQPAGAIAAASAVQEQLERTSWPEGVSLAVRMGVHTGTAQERDGDYFGPNLNRAARLMSAGAGGQVLVSEVTAAMVTDQPLTDLGEHRLKDMSGPKRVWQLGSDSFAALKTVGATSNNLPAQRTSLVGRDAEVEALVESVDAERLVTLVGVGGTGKTRLALAAAEGLLARFTDGVWVVDLQAVGRSEEVPLAFATAAGVQCSSSADAVTALIDGLGGTTTLLVVDNCEHVLDAVADVVDELTLTPDGVHVLATSREPLGVDGERVTVARPLDSGAALQLFVERAAAARSDIDLSGHHHEISELCDRLDGLPLAIELAAAQVRARTVSEISSALNDRLDGLRGRRRVERHQTLRATVQWSFDLLTDPQRDLFTALSVFAGSFDEPAARHVLGAEPRALPDLVERSMLERDGDRYRMLETMRQFGEDLRVDHPGSAGFEHRFLEYYRNLVSDVRPQLMGPDEPAAHRRLDVEWPNLRAVHTELHEQDANATVDLVDGLYWHVANWPRAECNDWFTGLAQLSSQELSPHNAALAQAISAMGHFGKGELAESIEAAQEVLALPEIGPLVRGRANHALFSSSLWSGLIDQALQAAVDSGRAAAELNNEWEAGFMAVSEAMVSTAGKNDPAAAFEIAERARVRADEIGSPTLRSWALGEWVRSHPHTESPEVLRAGQLALELATEAGTGWHIQNSRRHIAVWFYLNGQHEIALTEAMEAAEEMRRAALGNISWVHLVWVTTCLERLDMNEASATILGGLHHAPNARIPITARMIGECRERLEAKLGTARLHDLEHDGSSMDHKQALAVARAAITDRQD